MSHPPNGNQLFMSHLTPRPGRCPLKRPLLLSFDHRSLIVLTPHKTTYLCNKQPTRLSNGFYHGTATESFYYCTDTLICLKVGELITLGINCKTRNGRVRLSIRYQLLVKVRITLKPHDMFDQILHTYACQYC